MKVVQTEVEPKLYNTFKNILETKGMTIKNAVRDAIQDWAIRNGDIRKDPLFDLSKVLDSGKNTDSSKIDEVIYSRKGIE